MTTEQNALADAILDWAHDNYATSYGASVLVECYTREELVEAFSNLKTAQSFAELRDEMFLNARF